MEEKKKKFHIIIHLKFQTLRGRNLAGHLVYQYCAERQKNQQELKRCPKRSDVVKCVEIGKPECRGWGSGLVDPNEVGDRIKIL